MSDPIDRQAVIDVIFSEPLYETGMKKRSAEEVVPAIFEKVKVLPSAQSEIIRCKDCKHYKFADNRALGMPVKMCKWFGFEDVDDDDFCSRAERRTDEGD